MQDSHLSRPGARRPRRYPPSCTFCWTHTTILIASGLCAPCASRPHYVRAIRQIAAMLDSRGRLRRRT